MRKEPIGSRMVVLLLIATMVLGAYKLGHLHGRQARESSPPQQVALPVPERESP